MSNVELRPREIGGQGEPVNATSRR
jgi:hypothetical protein